MQQTDFADIMTALEANSRTFFIPITRLPEGLKESITSAYLCMRAIDDIEDHPALDNETKAALLREISVVFQRQTYETGFDISDQFQALFRPYRRVLPPVSVGLGRWASYAPTEIAPAIWDATAAMADRMAYWASVNWKVQTQSDLDAYTYSVAGTVGLLVATILTWYDGTQLDRGEAINFGRALQVTNIARNRAEDLARDVDFYPQGWNDRDVRDYARHWISRTEDYVKTIPPAPFQYFIQLPMALAKATLDALDSGQQKLSREAVMEIAGQMSY
jgi:farnesyl-diphosphate farnesyltransferase